jgi:hypothetical protein
MIEDNSPRALGQAFTRLLEQLDTASQAARGDPQNRGLFEEADRLRARALEFSADAVQRFYEPTP